jgi:hypothetical protein
MKTKRNVLSLCLALAAVCASGLRVHAQVAFAGSAAALGANDAIDWAQTGPSGYNYGWQHGTAVPVRFDAGSTLALAATVSSTNLSRVDQGNGWNGYFSAGTALLWNQNAYADSSGGITTTVNEGGDEIHIQFAAPVNGAGAQIEASPGIPFAYAVRAYDSNGNLLGSSSGAAGGSATPFIGLASPTNNIAEIVFAAVANGTSRRNFVIGPVFINDTNYIPAIISQPRSAVVNAYSNTSFAVAAASLTPLSYQWFFNGSPLDGATNSVLSITNAGGQNQGTYQVRVGNTFGSVVSSVASLWLAAGSPGTLGIALVGHQPVLFWSVSATNYALQTTTNLAAGNWMTVSQDNSGVVTITNATGAAFFRLQ